MPVIGIPVDMLLARIATKLDRDQLVEHLQHLGCDVEGYATMQRFGCQRCDNIVEITASENPPVLCDRCGVDYKEHPELQSALGDTDVIRMELLAVRPDMFDPGGLARVLRNYLGESDQPADYQLAPPTLTVEVDRRLAETNSFRPCIACAVVRDFTLDEDLIKTVMKLQENLHWALGRDRKRASIGVYDLDTISGPRFDYRTVAPGELKFAPLGHAENDQLTPQQILEQHAKGVAYARLLSEFDRYPLLADGTGKVLSMPPIINSEETRLSRKTTNFFIDVTGTEQRIVDKTLNILVTALAELDHKGRLEQVTIRYADRTIVTPDLTPQTVTLEAARPGHTIGVALDGEAVAARLRQMGHGVRKSAGGAERLEVEVPAYRNDIMHPIDLVEDVAIAYGYHNIETSLVPTMTVGAELPVQGQMNLCRGALAGQGFLEVITLLLSSPEQQYDALLLPRSETSVEIDNPISVEQTIIRGSLVPGLLDTFSTNTDHELPQLIFEVGNVSRLDPAAETGAGERCLVAAGAIGPRVDYAQIRSTCEALLRELGYTLDAEPDDSPCFIPGRGAKVIACRDGQRHCVGRMGELHPQVLENSKLVQPASVFEVELEGL